MQLGMSLSAFTALHVIISFIGLGAGIVITAALVRNTDLRVWTHVFLAATILTSTTGFLFPATQLLPSHIVGILSLVILAAACLAYYSFKANGIWRWVYVIAAVMAFYLNAFVAVVQAFLKIPALHSLAPAGKEPPFLAAQGVLLMVFVLLGALALRKFHPAVAAAKPTS